MLVQKGLNFQKLTNEKTINLSSYLITGTRNRKTYGAIAKQVHWSHAFSSVQSQLSCCYSKETNCFTASKKEYFLWTPVIKVHKQSCDSLPHLFQANPGGLRVVFPPDIKFEYFGKFEASVYLCFYCFLNKDILFFVDAFIRYS